MRILCFLGWSLGFALFGGCKTKEKLESTNSSSSSVLSKIDSNGVFYLATPQDLMTVVPTNVQRYSPQAQQINASLLNGLSLTGLPVSDSGIEEVIFDCYKKDSKFILQDWSIYMELESDGISLTKQEKSADRCSEVMLSLKSLNKQNIYNLYVAFLYTDAVSKKKTVYYSGSLENFKPDDKTLNLVLAKEHVDTEVKVDIEMSDKDKCFNNNMFWNGSMCIVDYSYLLFTHTDQSDYTSKDVQIDAKCLTASGNNNAVLASCNSNMKNQVMIPIVYGLYHSTDILKNVRNRNDKTYTWYVLKFSGKDATGQTFCLSSGKDPGDGRGPIVLKEPCIEAALTAGALDTAPISNQLWSIVSILPKDGGVRESFKLVNAIQSAQGDPQCISVPPIAGDLSKVAPTKNGVTIRLSSCNLDAQSSGNDSDVNTISTQSLKWIQ